MRRVRRTIICWSIAAAGVLTTTYPASAFYWKGWPGANLRPEPTLLTPTDQFIPDVPPVNPIFPPGGNDKPPVDLGPTPPPEHVPEPATGVVALIGLAAVAGRWVRKKCC